MSIQEAEKKSKQEPAIIILKGKEINRENITHLIESGKQFDILFPRQNITFQDKDDDLYD